MTSNWNRSEDWSLTPPDWTDAGNVPDITSYCHGFGTSSARINICDEILTVESDHRSIKRGMAWFLILFVPAFTVGTWLMVPHPQRIIFAVGGPLAGIALSALLFGLMDQHDKAGNYLIVDRVLQTVELPRQRLVFPYASVVRFQWIRGTTKRDGEEKADLNILIQDGTGKLMRYHVIGESPRSLVEKIVEFANLPLEERKLGWLGRRDTDCKDLPK